MLALAHGVAAAVGGAGGRHHVIAILADDYGWADVSYHRPAGYAEVQTPNIDRMVKSGVELDRNYVFKFCSPTRTAAQTGRNPIHVNTQNLDPLNYNPDDPVSGMVRPNPRGPRQLPQRRLTHLPDPSRRAPRRGT